jgi:tetratricopeptide (TPR) repeat protein
VTRAAALLLVTLALPVFAHEGLHEQIAEVTRQSALAPGNAALYLRRGELHRLHQELDLAAADYDQAALLNPELPGIDLARGLMLFDAGRFTAALEPLGRYVARHPEDAHGHVSRARALLKAGRAGDAAAEYAAAEERAPAADPDLILERARALAAAGQVSAAVKYLDATMAKLGPLVTLQLAAIDLEVQAGSVDAALQRVDTVMAAAARKESWLARRGDILRDAGRATEARAAYQQALDAIDTLPDARRRTPATRALEERVRQALAR